MLVASSEAVSCSDGDFENGSVQTAEGSAIGCLFEAFSFGQWQADTRSQRHLVIFKMFMSCKPNNDGFDYQCDVVSHIFNLHKAKNMNIT